MIPLSSSSSSSSSQYQYQYGSIIEEDNNNNNNKLSSSLSILISKYNHLFVWLIFVVVILLGPLNFVLYKLMFVQYGDDEQYFVSQCVNFQYVIIGGIALYIIYKQGQITDDMIQISPRKFIIMGVLDCLAGFLAANGAKYTNGGVQQLLNQSLIPLTMLASYIFLKKISTVKQIIGAFIIFLGVFIVILPNIINSNMGSPLSSLIYAASNIPYALSFCYKEYGFKNLSIHVIYLTQLVSVYQFIIGFLLAPLMASLDGRTFTETAHSFTTGFNCFIGIESDACIGGENSFYYLTGYCLVNFTFNTLGLYLVKLNSATLNSISYAIILPITTLTFTCPFLGRYREKFNVNILEGLIVVMIGFIIWKLDDTETDILSRQPSSVQLEMGIVVTKQPPLEPVVAFNERTIFPIMIKKKNRK